MCMHLRKMIWYGWYCGWLPTRWRCASPQFWQQLYWSSFLMGTTASECGTAWEQCHNTHVVILLVVLCTTGSWLDLARRLRLMRSSLLQYRDVKRSKRKIDYYKWCQEVSYTKQIIKHFFVMWQAIKIRWAILFKLSHRTVIDRAVESTMESTTVMLLMYRCSMVLMLRACLNWHFVVLHAQTLSRMELITTVRGTSTSTTTSN